MYILFKQELVKVNNTGTDTSAMEEFHDKLASIATNVRATQRDVIQKVEAVVITTVVVVVVVVVVFFVFFLQFLPIIIPPAPPFAPKFSGH